LMYAQLDSLRTIIIARPGHPARTRHDIISAISDTPHPSRDTVVHGAAAPHTSPHIARVVEHAGTRPQIAYPALDASTRAHNPAPAHATDRTCPCYNDQAPRRYDAVRSPAGRVVRPRSYGAANHSPGGGGGRGGTRVVIRHSRRKPRSIRARGGRLPTGPSIASRDAA